MGKSKSSRPRSKANESRARQRRSSSKRSPQHRPRASTRASAKMKMKKKKKKRTYPHARSPNALANASKSRAVLKYRVPNFTFGNTKDYEFTAQTESSLGRGASAEVFLCTRKDSGATRAVKVFKACASDDEWALFKVQREYHVLASLQKGVNIVQIHDVLKVRASAHKISYCFVFEYVDGNEMDDRLAFGKLSEDVKRWFLHEVLKGIQHIHSKGFIHRDIKMKNILFDPSTYTVRLIDFGFGMYYIPNESKDSFLGTAHWKSPEILLKYPRYDYAVDMWAFGVLCCYVFFGGYMWTPNPKTDVQMRNIAGVLGTADLEQYMAKYHLDSVPLPDGARSRQSLEDVGKMLTEKNSYPEPPKELYELAEVLLVYDHIERLNAEECLLCPFLRTAPDPTPDDVSDLSSGDFTSQTDTTDGSDVVTFDSDEEPEPTSFTGDSSRSSFTDDDTTTSATTEGSTSATATSATTRSSDGSITASSDTTTTTTTTTTTAATTGSQSS